MDSNSISQLCTCSEEFHIRHENLNIRGVPQKQNIMQQLDFFITDFPSLKYNKCQLQTLRNKEDYALVSVAVALYKTSTEL